MNDGTQDRRSFKSVGKAVALSGTIFLVAWVFATTDISEFFKAIRHADIPFFTGLALSFSLAHLLLDSIGVLILLEITGVHIGLRRLVPVRATSYLAGFVNYNLGLALIAAAAGRNSNLKWTTLVSPLLALNVIDLFVMGAMLEGGLTISGSGNFNNIPHIPLIIGGAAAMMILPVTVAVSRRLATGPARTDAHRGSTPTRPLEKLNGLLDTFRALNPGMLAILIGLRTIFLLTDASGDYLMARSFNLNIPLEVFAQFFPVDSFACVLPFTFAGIGPTLVLMRLFFTPYAGADLTTGAIAPVALIDAFSVSTTTILVVVRTILALICLPIVVGIWKEASPDNKH